MKKLYVGANRFDAAAIGFDDQYIYDVINKTAEVQQVEIEEIDCEECKAPFKEWEEMVVKTQY